ncbi:acyl-CoA dehydrogenase family protein [uncultured Xylophilus sp.]|uniref:acyl-CoA dehydrogenase family protein n=1 Tax=uncultured Xylophilus sp. TaxID=296832 RepID=UPI0025CC8A38|nr:acyl-CoA dehydrogenase family protein [uncultured Xylophilus sp.]
MRRDAIPDLVSSDPCGVAQHAWQAATACSDDIATGDTARRWRWLADTTGRDVVVGKLLESHLDALSILNEVLGADAGQELRARVLPVDGLWGVWASEGPAGAAVRVQTHTADGTVLLSGRKCWCSGAADVGAALVTARDADDRSQLFAVAMAQPAVTVTEEGWSAVGMAGTRSVDVLFDGAVAVPIGAPGAYLERHGFWHGAAGVAACWHGAATAIAAPLRDRVAQRGAEADGLLAAHLGAVDCALAGSACTLRAAAEAVDGHRAGGTAFGRREALRVRGIVEHAAATVIDRVGRALGAGPLCRDAAHARRVADLSVFLRQSHAEWDLAVLGRLGAAVEGDTAWML